MRKIFDNFGILTFFLLNIALPTVDVITDFLMIVKLFRGAHGCVNPRWWSEEHQQWQSCQNNPETFCTNITLGTTGNEIYENTTSEIFAEDNRESLVDSGAICDKVTISGIFTWECRDPYLWSRDYQDWEACRDSPTSFCSQQTNETNICQFETHPKFGTSLMIPYLFNYLFSFLTWWRLEDKRKRTFLFPLVNMFAQLGRCTWGVREKLKKPPKNVVIKRPLKSFGLT